jgi:hypothetical protein
MDGGVGAHGDAQDLVVHFASKSDVGVAEEIGQEGLGPGTAEDVKVATEWVGTGRTALMVGKPLVGLTFTGSASGSLVRNGLSPFNATMR